MQTGCPTVLEFLEFLELFWNFFGTGNVLEKGHFFRLVLELFLNSKFLTSDLLRYNISGCPLFGSPICEKILPHLGRPCVLENCENSVRHPGKGKKKLMAGMEARTRI